ncbi:uridine kinase [Streptomyces sp. SID11385]|uniref:uridine kinase n=1 Tax=Streptomyces sp. SID11385 TaxID=2706031 RepID=UPI0013C902A5|nr:uridine kinase [Streptomyces sp. SID11385]
MRFEAITWERLTADLTERLLATTPADGGDHVRVALDGAPAARPEALADRLAEALRAAGRPALPVATSGFLRPASLRFEHGRHDPDSYLTGWFDTPALWREVFTPLDPGGNGRVLPDLWDPVTDRASRTPYVTLPPGGFLLLHGPFLFGHWFPFDLGVHLSLTEAALRRRTPEAEQWTLPAFARYEAEQTPLDTAGLVVRADDPRHPARRVPEED